LTYCVRFVKLFPRTCCPAWPATMLKTVLFSEEGTDTTRVTVTWEVIGEATPEEIKTFLDNRPGMTLGWTVSFDKLETLLEGK